MAQAIRFPNAAAMSAYSDQQKGLYRAYSQSYRTETNHRVIAFVSDLVFVVIGLAIAVLRVTQTFEWLFDLLIVWSPVVALVWLTVRETDLLGVSKDHRRRAVRIQEQFDLTFWMPETWRENWNHLLCGPPMKPRAINELANNYDYKPIPDHYWVDATGLQPNAAALLRIQQSAGWAAKGHARYARLSTWVAVVSIVLVLSAILLADLRTRDAVVVLMAMAPFPVGRIRRARTHRCLKDRREQLESHTQRLLRGPNPVRERDVRASQDELFRLRLENRQIPTWLYNRFAARDREAIDSAVAQEAKLLGQVHRKG